jgi:thiosulfate dehydrogenase [quinone] large subunit
MVDIAKNDNSNGYSTLPLVAPQHQAVAAPADTYASSLAMPVLTGRAVRPRPRPARRSAATPDHHLRPATRYLLAAVRIALGWIFLWAFLDKTFGLGHDTTNAKSWLNGGSPTKGFLGSAAKGPFASFYHSIAGAGAVDVLFMVALLGIGAALILGIGMRLAGIAGAVLTVMMWTVVLPPDSNPFMDDHLIYAAVLLVLALLSAGDTLGLGRVWSATALVKRAAWLK